MPMLKKQNESALKWNKLSLKNAYSKKSKYA